VIVRKTREEIETMARAGALVARAHEAVTEAVRPGVSTLELDAIAEEVIRDAGATPSFKGYHGFPATLCTSVDREIIHGIPRAEVVLREGSLLSVDCGAIVDGFHGDSAVTHVVGGEGTVDERTRELVEVTREAMWAGLRAAEPGNRLGDIGAAIQAVAERAGLGIVREYVGHGVGRALHEDPSVPNYGVAGRGRRLRVGHVLAIEPMLTLGDPANATLGDDWTVVTIDGSLSAHWEHTVAITPEGPRILTARSDEPSTL
jgi:methionyl aminopeptidase